MSRSAICRRTRVVGTGTAGLKRGMAMMLWPSLWTPWPICRSSFRSANPRLSRRELHHPARRAIPLLALHLCIRFEQWRDPLDPGAAQRRGMHLFRLGATGRAPTNVDATFPAP